MIFGSTAAKHWYPDFREPKDTDVLDSETKVTRLFQAYWFGPSSEWVCKHNSNGIYVDPEFLYTFKAAHAKWNIHWEKTMADIVFFQRKGLKIHDELYKLLMKDFIAVHGKKWASLKGEDSKTFFEDAVKRKYVHDSIHEAIAYYDSPLYERILKGDGTVSCSKEKFDNLSESDKLKLIREEIFVTALERFLIPENFCFSKQRAYWLSLKKLITTMSSGWFSRYIIENYSSLYQYQDDYVKRFNQNQNKLQLCS